MREALESPRSKVTLASLAYSANMGPGTGFRLANDDLFRSAKGVSRRRLVETYGDLEVVGATAAAETDLSGQLTGNVYGRVALGLEEDIPDPDACQTPISEMLEIAIRAENYDVSDERIENKDGRRLVYIDPDTHLASLAYRVEFFYAGQRVVSRPAYFIDACNRSVLLHFDQIQNVSVARDSMGAQACACNPSAAGIGGNPKTGRIEYNKDGRCLAVQVSGTTCTMSNTYGYVVDNQQTRDRFRTRPVRFTCRNGYSDPVNGAFGVASDAFYFGTITGRLYVEKYGIRALPYPPRIVIHYGSCYQNAFWDGTDMYFGDGCSTLYPLVSQDIVAHELAHGITSRNSRLFYSLQSGGINEAFSDISGEIADKFGHGSNDWMVGYELYKRDRPLRYFINPPDDGRSISHVRDYSSSLGVHSTSGIYNHAFYQMVAIEGLPIYHAYKCFLDSNLQCWQSLTQFWEGACCVMQMCYDNGYDVIKVRSAFSRVGIYLFRCDFDGFSSIVKSGETRREILVSATRNPILAVENAGDGRVSVTAEAQDLFSTVDIEVVEDAGGEVVLVSGSGSVDVESELDTVYVRLSSPKADDVKVDMKVA
ncbi:elastase-like [Aplysia californica]|uniref:Elastase-like n=1 Tax=Aplysia californica TaxID=6500 RepID=A0ABM0JUT4_APLCA|nr:elastase-like [Aplysia californica]